MREERESPPADVLARGCARPFKTPSGVWVRCGSRVKSRCASCAELYRQDWAAIARSGIFDGPAEHYRFYLLTLTAPSFGRVHRVPRAGDGLRCGCGCVHSVADAAFRGVPLDFDAYDYDGQVAWNRDAGVLWTNTVRRLRGRWGTLEFFVVREWQDRGVLHVHVIVRIARYESPTADALRDAARSAVAFSKIDGSIVQWGDQAQCDAFRADGSGAKTIWYLSKALNYVLKDVGADSGEVPVDVWRHQVALGAAARRMRCSRNCEPSNCESLVHRRYGSRSHVVSQSRRTRTRPGWSFTGLNRTVQRRIRRAFVLARESARDAAPASAVNAVGVVESVARDKRLALLVAAPGGP